jgi:argininosuccinate lyase
VSGEGRGMGGEGTRLWGGRFAGGPAEAFDRLNSSLDVDRRLWPHDVEASRAHARMLAAQGIIPSQDAEAIDAGLDRIADELACGDFSFRDSDEDIHTAVERRLTELAGDAGRRLHTARSRNDQVITDTLLYLRDRASVQRGMLRELAEALLRQAESHVDTLLPGYTHGQRAQPVRLAHHLLAYVWMLERDRVRLCHVIEALGECPLGSGALAGVGFPVDRARVAAELGFARPSRNSLDAVSSRDALIDYLHFAAQLGVHLSRLGAEIVLWAGEESGFVELDDAFSSGSSMLPQKKNPDAAELARAKAPRLAADLAGLIGVMSGLPLAYNKDLQEDKVYLFDAVDTVELLLPAMAGMIATAAFRADRMGAAASGGALAATDLADRLVTMGWPFRSAHEAVGRLVRVCLERGIGLAEAGRAELQEAGLGGIVPPDLSAEASVEAKAVPGGTARAAVLDQLEAVQELVASW